MATLTEEQRAFLRENPWPAVATTLRPDGSPHSTPVWVDEVDGEVWFNTVVGRKKEQHLRADPRAALILVDPANQFRWVAVSGAAALQLEGADEHMDKLAKKYLGQDRYPWHDPSQRRIIVRIRPEKVDSTGFDGAA